MIYMLEKTQLVDISEEHLSLVLSWRNQKHIRHLMYNDKIISMEEHIDWFNQITERNNIVKIFYLGETPLGVINITKIDYLNKKCEWGFYIGPSSAPKGVGTIMGYTTLNFIFNNLEIRKLCAEIIGYNTTSLKFHTKLGFKTEGKLLQHVQRKDGFADIILMAIFRKQWEEQEENIRKIIEGKSL